MNKKILVIVAIVAIVLVCSFFILRNFFPDLLQINKDDSFGGELFAASENATLEDIETKLDAAIDAKLADLG